MGDFFGLFGAFILLGLIIAAFVTGIMFLIPAAIVAVACVLIYSHVSPNSKKNVEQAEITETHRLYEQAKALTPIGQDESIRFAATNFQNLQVASVASQIFEMEGFTPPTKPPPIVTGIEGGRYRDEIKRYINLAHDSENVQRFKDCPSSGFLGLIAA